MARCFGGTSGVLFGPGERVTTIDRFGTIR
jgi:hypothetical protein